MRANTRVLISGAGIAGLTSAIWLGRHGFRPVVVERAAGVRADGFIISFSHHSYRFAEELGLLPRLRATSAGIRASSYHDRYGSALLKLDYQRLFDGVQVVQIMRDDMQTLLFDEAKELVEFRFGTEIEAIDQTGQHAEVTFNDGSSEVFDVVIGADGLHSAVRTLSFDPDEISHCHLGLGCAAFKLDNVLGLRHKFETHMERNRYMVVFNDRHDGLAAVFVWQTDMSSPPPQEDRQAILCAAFDGAPSVTAQVLDMFPADAGVYMDPVVQVMLPQWHSQRVVLLGDAAHCMTLLSGQGASAAFTGASRLCKALIDLPPVAAFARYEQEQRPMVDAVQPLTRNAVKWYVPGSRWRELARDSAMRYLPDWYFHRYFKSKYTKA